jgi:8-oxo-dGTP diphosphatase
MGVLPKIGVGVMLLRNNKVLLGKRNADPQKADSELHGEGAWTMPGGKLEFGEKLVECAYREVLEETGIRVDKEKLKIVSVADDIAPDAHFVTIGFLCPEFSGEAKLMEPEEIIEWKWFALDNLPSPLFGPSRKILENFENQNL